MEIETANGNGNGSSVKPIHLSLQGKGGVGKSLVSSILAQYFMYRSLPVQCIDTDPVNRTLSQYKGLEVQQLRLLRDGNVDQRGFDDFLPIGGGILPAQLSAGRFDPGTIASAYGVHFDSGL